MEQSFFVYILECSDGSLYTGSTNNLEKRIKEHNTSKNGAHYTKIRRPVFLKYYETCDTYSDSRKKEAEIKRLSREEKIEYMKQYRKGVDQKFVKKCNNSFTQN